MEKQKLGFFKRVIISIKDFEKYDVFAIESPKEALKYLCVLMLIFSVIATAVYDYKILNGGLEEIFSQAEEQLNEIMKIDVQEMKTIIEQNYVLFFAITFFTVLFAYLFNTFIDAIMLGILGLIVARIVGMRIKYKATFNIGIYSLTLPVILQLIYLVVNILTGFEIRYFQWMYATISYIYVVVAILMIKTEFINQQVELMKIKIEQERIKQEDQNLDENDNKDKENKDTGKDDKSNEENDEKEEKKEDNNLNEEPKGDNA